MKKELRIKVCGMKHPHNMEELAQLPIHYMGLIFYHKSPRFVGDGTLHADSFPPHIKRVGVFVNAEVDYIRQCIATYRLDMVQLHGNESPEECRLLRQSIPVIKALSVSQIADLDVAKSYEGTCDYLLFDTKTPAYGGSGTKFDWSILSAYTGETPFLLSGGISVDDVEQIGQITHAKLFGIDLNSRFEIEPGLKNIDLLQHFITTLNNEQD